MKTATTPIRVGDVVQFTGRGRTVTGTVARLRVKTSRKRKALLARLELLDPRVARYESADTLVAEIVEQDTTRGFWTVPVTLCAVVRRAATHDAAPARDVVAATRAHRRDSAQQRTRKNWDAARALRTLRPGDPIEVEFNDIGWAPARFLRFTSSGTVAYARYGRARFTPPQYVRPLALHGDDIRRFDIDHPVPEARRERWDT